MVRIARVWAILAGLAAALADQSGRAMTIQDLLLAIRVTDPQLSPIVRIEALPRSTERAIIRPDSDHGKTPRSPFFEKRCPIAAT